MRGAWRGGECDDLARGWEHVSYCGCAAKRVMMSTETKKVSSRRKRRKLKRRLAIFALLFLVVCGAGAYGGYRYMLKLRVAGWRSDGITAAQAGDHARAAELLGQYLQRVPQDVEALTFYIPAREAAELPNGQHLGYTVAALKILLGLEPDRIDDRRHLLELYVRLDNRPETIDTANTILTAHPGDLRALAVKTDFLERIDQPREAFEVAKQWCNRDPKNINAHISRLQLRDRLGHLDAEIVSDADALRTTHPDDPGFMLLQGIAYALAGNDKQATEWFKTVARQEGLSTELAIILVQQFDKLYLTEDSLAVLEQQVNRGAGAEIRHLLARRHWQLGKWNECLALLGDIDPASITDDATLAAFKAIALSNLGRNAESDACRAGLAGRGAAAAKAWTLILRQVIDAAPVDDKQLIADCKSALSIDPENPYLWSYLGDAYARMGETDLAIQAWRVATPRALTWSVPAVRLVDALVQKGRPDQAAALAHSVYRRTSSAAAIISLARAYATNLETGGMGRAEDLMQLVSQVQEQLPGEEQTLLIQIHLTAQQGRKPEAVKLTHDAIDREPAHSEPFLLAVATLSLKHDFGLTDAAYDRSEKAHGLTAGVAYARAISLAIAQKAGDGLKQFDAAAQRSGKSGAVAWRLARARYLDITLDPAAKSEWTSLVAAFPDNLDVQNAAVAARAVRGDWECTGAALANLEKLVGKTGLAWRLARARLLIDSPRTDADIEEGSILLNEVIRQYPKLPEPRVLLARALVQLKRLDAAIEHLSVAVREDPSSVPTSLQLAALLQSRGDFDRVRQVLDRVTPDVRTPEQRRQAALLLAQQGQSDKAIELLTTRPSVDVPNAAPQPNQELLVAILHRRQREFAKAEQIVSKLLAEKPDVPGVQFAASLFLAQGRTDDAEKALALLDKLKLEPGIRQLVWGSYRAEAGDIAGATKHYRAAVDEFRENSAAWRVLAACHVISGKSQDLVATIGEAATAMPQDAHLAKLQRHSALLSESVGDPEVRPLIVAVLRDPTDADVSFELLRLLGESRKDGDYERLIGRLTQLIERHPGHLSSQMQLVQCYWSLGKTTAALAAVRHAMSTFPSAAEPARVAVGLCQMANRPQEMAVAAQAWKMRSSGDPMAADTALVRAHIMQGLNDAALGGLAPYLPAAKADPDRHADVLTTCAVAMVKLKMRPAANELLWPLTSRSAEWRMRWMQVGLEVPDPLAAAEWLDRVATNIPADAVADRVALYESYDRLARRGGDQKLIRRAWDGLREMAANPQAPLQVLMAAAMQAERAGDFAAAESLYHRTLAVDPNIWQAQNNLAMLILTRGGNVEQARALALAATKLQPRQASAYDTLALSHAKAGDLRSAATAMRSAIRTQPDNAQWHIQLAQYLLDSGDVGEAGKALNTIDNARLDLQRLPPDLRRRLDGIREGVTRGRG